jgi:hypothetical protein
MRNRIWRITVVLAGITLCQALLYGPSLIGEKILLPLDLLAQPGAYLPRAPESEWPKFKNHTLGDLVLLFEPARQFAASEVRAGRFPMWTPYGFAGAPFIWPKFSPFLAVESLTDSPVILAWGALLAALVAGTGMYAFCRRVLGVSFWPAALASWCYPMTGFFIFWQGFATSLSVYWLPWLLLAVDKSLRQTSPLAPVGLALATCLVLVSGHVDVAGQVLLASGLYGLWRVVAINLKQRLWRSALKQVVTLVVAWTIGFMLASPAILPGLDYARTGARFIRRGTHEEERPPIGIMALPQVVLPDMYGSDDTESLRIAPDVQIESSATGYAGVLATLLAAPLALCSRSHRSLNWFWFFLIIFGLSWCVNLPVAVSVLRLPGLNLMSHNRLVFLASFGILALSAVGLETLRGNGPDWRRWFWLPMAVAAAISLWCLARTEFLPEPIATQLEGLSQRGALPPWLVSPGAIADLRATFAMTYAISGLLCAASLTFWLVLRFKRNAGSWLLKPVAVAMLADLLWFSCGRNPQCEPSLYYPRLPASEEIRHGAPGRIIGVHCFPPNLGVACGLRDPRGYDGIDPHRLVELVKLAADPHSSTYPYAAIQWLTPMVSILPDGSARLPPVLDLLGVRYVIFRNTPPAGLLPFFQGLDYWVLTNATAMPRLFVPKRVEVVSDDSTRLAKLASPDFKPGDVAFVEDAVNLPSSCEGTARIVQETPTHITADLHMTTAGLVFLADQWNAGWAAFLNGKRVPVLRADHALRGVVAPAGAGRLEFRYQPASFSMGLALAGCGTVIIVSWLAFVFLRSRLTARRP